MCVDFRMFTALYPHPTSLSLLFPFSNLSQAGIKVLWAFIQSVFHLTIGNVERQARVNKNAKPPNERSCCSSLICCPKHHQISLSLSPRSIEDTSLFFSFFLEWFTYHTYSRLSVSWLNVRR